jgi:integrase
VPPDVEQLCVYLQAAVEILPDVAPGLTLGAVTGMRRGELVSLRRDRIYPEARKLKVDTAVERWRSTPTRSRCCSATVRTWWPSASGPASG